MVQYVSYMYATHKWLYDNELKTFGFVIFINKFLFVALFKYKLQPF